MKKNTWILVIILLLALPAFSQQQNNSVFNIPVTINQTDKPLSEVLNEITGKARVFFSYDASIIVSDRKVSVKTKNAPLTDVLNQLFDPSLIRFIEKENQVIISLYENTSDSIFSPTTTPAIPGVLTLTGRVADEKNNEPVPFASISVFNKPVGTITNSNGEFILKLEKQYLNEAIIVSCIGYSQKTLNISDLTKDETISLHPVSIQIKEVEVKAISPGQILDNMLKNLDDNYGADLLMMKGFYRETLKQDKDYINVSEAVIEILKSRYNNSGRVDKIRILKGRKSPNVKSFQWVNFKLMGGPTTMAMLDILKNMGNFIDPDSREMYKYGIDKVIWYHGRPVYIVNFKPKQKYLFPSYQGEMYIDRETYALLHASFGFSKQGLRKAGQSLIRKKPRGYKVRAENVKYTINYRYSNGICYLYSTKASIIFKVKNHKEKINSHFSSVSEMLVTDFHKSQVKRFPRKEVFNRSDIFTENIESFDAKFWGNFNIFKPDIELKVAIENLKKNYKSNGNLFLYNKNYLTKTATRK